MKKLIAVLIVALAGCASTKQETTVMTPWPDVPSELLEPAKDLDPLPNDKRTLSDLIDNANTNYTEFYLLKEKYNAWQDWYDKQKKIHEALTK